MKIPVGSSNMLFAGFGTQRPLRAQGVAGKYIVVRIFKEEWVIKTA